MKKNIQDERIKKWNEKRDTSAKVDKELSWRWLRKGDLKIQTESLLCAAQEQALRTNYLKFYIDKTANSPLCRMCGNKGGTVQHIICECEMLAEKEYKRRHDNVDTRLHWDLCKKNRLKCNVKWYEHEPDSVVENDDIKLLWDFNIQCDNMIEARRPDIAVLHKKEKKCLIVDAVVPGDCGINEKEKEKIDKYQDLRREVNRLWQQKKVHVVQIVIGVLGSISKNFISFLHQLEINTNLGELQKAALLGTARILRKVLELWADLVRLWSLVMTRLTKIFSAKCLIDFK